MGNSKSNASVSFNAGNVGFLILTAFFVWLKVEGKIDWSWWIVFAPIWVPACVGLVILGLIAAIMFFIKGD